ncbi:MAG: hypothetical protein LBT36_03045, partial [Oscillospiraceae bacterium]|nr:hypothetical protein [Oscillospiraceae bacterium]
KHKALIIGVMSVLVVAAAVVTALTLLAGSSYQKAELNFLKSLASAVPTEAAAGARLDFSADYSPSDVMRENLAFPQVSLFGSISAAGQRAAASLGVSAGGAELSDILVTLDGSAATLSVPDLTEYYLRWALGGEETDSLDLTSLDQKKLQTTLTGIAKTYFKLADEIAEVEKGVELTGGATTLKCDVYTLAFTEDVVAKLGTAIIEELRANDNLMDFIVTVMAAQGYELDADDLDDELDNALDELEELDGNTRLFRMTVWVSGNAVVARKFDKFEGAGDVTFSYQYLTKGKTAHYELKLTAEDTDISFAGDFERSGESWSGTPKLTIKDNYYDEEILSLKLKCTDLRNDDGIITGTNNLTGSFDDETFLIDFNLDLGKRGTQQTITVSGAISDDYEEIDVGELTLSYGTEKIDEVDMPRLDASRAVVPGDYSDENVLRSEAMANELDAYMENADYDDTVMEIFGGLIWEFWDYVDDISWYASRYSDSYVGNNYAS